MAPPLAPYLARRQRMVFEILKRTPLWVFPLFFALLAFGYYQTRSRVVSIRRAMILPVTMIGLSAFSVVSAFGLMADTAVPWLVGVVCALLLNRWLRWPWDVSYREDRQAFSLPGSWFPLALMMCIFFARYAVAVARALRLSFTGSELFPPAVSSAYGLLSGVFLAGGVRLWQLWRGAREVAA